MESHNRLPKSMTSGAPEPGTARAGGNVEGTGSGGSVIGARVYAITLRPSHPAAAAAGNRNVSRLGAGTHTSAPEQRPDRRLRESRRRCRRSYTTHAPAAAL